MLKRKRVETPFPSQTNINITDSNQEQVRKDQEKAQHDDLQRFVNEYLGRYDRDRKRTGLDWFYQESALITFATTPEGFASCLDPLPDKDNKNLDRFNNDFMIESRDDALTHFASLPKSRHLLPTIIIDLMEMHPERVGFTISGFLKEMDEESDKLLQMRHFMRTFILTPLSPASSEPDFRISCEVNFVSSVSEDRLRQGVIPSPGSESAFICDIMLDVLPNILKRRKKLQQEKIKAKKLAMENTPSRW